MKRLRDCYQKTVGKLITKEDADHLWKSAQALQAGGMTPIEAERQAVQNAIEQANSNGESILEQIRGQRPAAYSQARNFWEQETIRKPGTGAPPPLPRFVTEAAYAPRRAAATPAAPVPVEQIVAVHNAGDARGQHGSTVNAAHGNLAGRNFYSVSVFPDLGITSPGKNITAEQINAFAAKAQAAGLDVSSPNLSIGTWWDAETDTTYIDIAFTTTDRAAAIALGQQANQKAIFSLKDLAEINTGGTGVAPENLPSIAERIGILFPPGYDVGRSAEPTTQAEAAGPPAGPPGTASRPAEGAVPGGAGEVQRELGGVQQEAPGEVIPPEIPAAPISDAAQEVVNNLPEEQRNAAQKAFARDDRDPLADDQRSRGQPVEKRRSAPVAPEKNKGLLDQLSKYGVWDKSVTDVLKNIASDPKQPRWVRALTDLLVQLGLGEGVDIRVVNTPNATWPALYDSNRKIVYINLSYKGDLARRLLHELLHHGTLNKLTNRESSLTPAELAAKRALQDMFDIVRKRREFKGVYGASRLHEFVSEVFANDSFRRKLNSIRPDGKVSLLQRFADAVRDLLIGDLPMRRGSLLDAAIKEAINVAGSRAVETPTSAAVAAQEQGSLAARQANEHPNFQEQIAETIAPMAEGNMGISDNDLIARKLDHEAAFYAEDERAAVEAAVDERAGKINATPAEIAEVKKRIEDDILYNRAYHAANEGWANKAIKVLGLEKKKGLTRGDPTKQNPSGIAFKIKYKDTPYTYARAPQTAEEAAAGEPGRPIQRFLKQGKPDKETGKPIDNPEWGKRVGQLAQKMFDNLQGIMARRGKGGDDARVAQVIVDQINWYRDMRTRLRAEFGSMSDYVADVIAGFSPITDVPGNWNNFIEYFRHVMRGDYDEAFRKFDEYISADPENRSSGTYKKEFPPEEFPDLWPRKLLKEDKPLFGANTGNALMAGLDLWRAVKSGTAPKARNFGLNLIGQSLKATIDRWAGRYLQRMHAPTWRLPPSIEGNVTGEHMTGGNVEQVSGDFGMGQDVFEQVAKRLRESGHEIFKEVTPADLQAILWFAEKEVWEMRKWTDIMGAGSSMNVVAQATAAQRYEAGTMPSLSAQPVTPAKLQREIQSETGYVYHATNQERLYEIAESGKLLTHKPNEFTEQDTWPDGSTQKRAYFSGNAATTWSFAPEDGTPVVVRTKADSSLGAESSTGDIYSSKPVSASKLEYLGEDNQWHPLKNLRPPEAGKEVSAKDEKLMAETIELRTNLNAEAHMLGAKMVPSVNIADGKESKTFDGEWITEPEYDPDNSVGHVARVAARLGKKAAHISRVIVNPYEVNDHITPGLHIFFKGRVGDAAIKGVLDKLKAAGITSGISLTVDPRVRPEIIKSLDPAAGANQYNGVRVQFIYGTASGMTRSQIEEAFADANDMLAKDASVAESRVLHYDTLVLNKGTDYDTSGKLTEHFKDSRAKAWSERARNEGAAAAARRDDVQKAIADRKRQDLELESRMDREREERIAAFAASQRKVQPKDRANDGGVDPPVVAAMQYEGETKVDRRWAQEFSQWQQGILKPEHIFSFGKPSSELRQAGFPEAEITLTQRVLGKHEFPGNTLFDLPRKLRDPIAVFKSRTVPGALTILTEIEHEGNNVLAAVHLLPAKGGQSEISSIRSIYPKNSEGILGWIDDGLTTYFHKERALRWLHRIAGSNSRRAWDQLGATSNIRTNEDVVKGPEGEGPNVAAMQYEDQQEPVRDPHGGRASLVRSMVNALTGASRDRGGIEVPESEQEVRGAPNLGGRTNPGRKGSAPVWRPLGGTFRKRESALYRKIESAAGLIRAQNPESGKRRDPAKYQNSQKLFDYLAGKETPTDPELRDLVAELRKEIPVIPAEKFTQRFLDTGVESDVFHDPNSGVVHKLFGVNDGIIGTKGNVSSYVPGQLSLGDDKEIRVSMGDRPTLSDHLGRMERANSHGALTPHELTAITPESHLVFTSPFVEGREVTQKNLPAALARAGVHLLTEMGGTSGVAQLPDGRWVLYDDLHPGNVRTIPGGRVEIIDANNRELDQYEINDLTTLEKMPPEKPPGPPKAKPPTKKAQTYSNAVVVAPMVETHHGTPHDWAAEKRVRFEDGTLRWIPMDNDVPPGATVIERAPAGRVRADKVSSGEGNAAYGWGVLYSAARKSIAEWYQRELSGESGEWFLLGTPISDYRSEIFDHLKRALISTDPYVTIDETVLDFRNEAKFRRESVEKVKASPMMDSVVRQSKIDKHLKAAREYEQGANALEKYKHQLVYRKGGKGNIYTVQLDVEDPELLDWFKPMRDQMHVFDKVAAKFGVTREQARKAHEENEMLADIANDLQNRVSDQISGTRDTELSTAELQNRHAIAEREWEEHFKQPDVKLGSMLNKIERKDSGYGNRPFDGEKFYEWLKDLTKSKKAASEHMNSAGVPGILFLDQESRGKVGAEVVVFENGERVYSKDGKWHSRVRATHAGDTIFTTSPPFSTKEEAESWVNERVKQKGFNNYVIFDPERIKVVAKNGEVVRTVADDLPAPPEPNIVEPVTVAAMSAEDVKDDRNLDVAPMAATGARRRYPWPWQKRTEKVAGYKPGGLGAPQAQLSREVGNFTQERERREKAVAYRAESMVKDLERAIKAGYGKQGPDKTQVRDIQMALGNLDNRMTPEQYNESLKYTNLAERRSFIETARHEAVDAARERQRVALGNLPDVVRKYVNRLRKQLDLESKELLKDPGIDTELRARVDSELGVFLHSNSYQHFESGVWGEHIKSDDPEAKRIRSAAEILFKNEVIGEKAHEYQVANPGTSDADALAHASALPNIDRMVENRLAAYLRKDANEVTRMHLLSGKIQIHDSGKLLSLNRENLPQEVRELWGQWTDPKINFVKTYTLLANHNASIRMQHSIAEDGQKNGYIWKPDPADPNSSPPADLVPLGGVGDHGLLADAYGPQDLKDGLANYNKPAVQDFLVNINRWSLMMKTTGNIASAVHNFFGNVAFSISNGNLLWAITMAPKTLISSTFRSFAVAGARATGMGGPALQEEAAEMIELGVFDTDIAIGTLRKMSQASQVGILVEKKLGPAAGLQAAGRVLRTGTNKVGAAFKETYQAADNWWKYFNYKIELAKQQWIHSGDASVTLDQMKRNAADMVMNTLPSYSRVPEFVRRSLGDESVLKYTGAFFTFQTESARTVVMNVTHAGRELVHGKNWKEQSIGAWRLGGMMAMLALPYALGMAARRMFGYDDDDERALRNSLPEYQKNASLLVMLPRDAKGNPRYMDLSWLNPYGLVHSAGIAASRAGHEGKGVGAAARAAGWSAVQPLIMVQPGVGTVMDLVRNQDSSRGGRQIYSPEDTVQNQVKDMGLRAMEGLAPGTLQNVIKTAESSLGYVGKSGREPDPLQDITAGLAGMPRVSTLELDRALETHVGVYKKTVSGAKALLNEAVATKAIPGPSVKAAYRQAQAKSLEHNIEMHRAFEGLKKLGLDESDARRAMEVGFGTEILKGGLGKHTIDDIMDGRFGRVEISKKMEDQAQENGRLDEYLDAMNEAEPFVYADELK